MSMIRTTLIKDICKREETKSPSDILNSLDVELRNTLIKMLNQKMQMMEWIFGYPDQFGGTMGKKFKMARLKNLLDDIHKKPMEEQYSYVKRTFNLWKEEYPQLDDVLFMGIML